EDAYTHDYNQIMKRIQNLNRAFENPKNFLIVTTIIIGVAFLFLTPKLTSRLFPQKRDMILKQFVQNVEKTHQVDPQKFWEFREFFSPGYYTFNRLGLESSMTDGILQAFSLQLLDASSA